jgi:hypothetical protein
VPYKLAYVHGTVTKTWQRTKSEAKRPAWTQSGIRMRRTSCLHSTTMQDSVLLVEDEEALEAIPLSRPASASVYPQIRFSDEPPLREASSLVRLPGPRLLRHGKAGDS